MSSKYFKNPFPDYSENCPDFLEGGRLRSDHPIALELDNKWKEIEVKLQALDCSDYSVYTGTSGIALLKMKRDPTNANTLREALMLLSLNRLKGKRHTFLCGDAGPLAIGIHLNHLLGNSEQVDLLCSKLKSLSQDVVNVQSDLPNEYLYGRAGYLYAILYVNKYVMPQKFDDEFVRLIIEAILVSGRNLSKAFSFKCPLMYEWHESYYLGAAHGVSGILYLLLQVKQYLPDDDLLNLIKPTIDYLTTQRFPSGNFPSSLGRDVDRYVQWCHGAPGFVYLFCEAYKVFHDPKYLQLASECGDVIWERGLLKKGYSICHGVAGNAYCFLELYQSTKEPKHLYRAIKFAEWCFDYNKEHEELSPDRPLSLYEGLAGRLYLYLDIQKPAEAKFPGFTL
ncbi:unnamed protein product [Acanthoscelides obtectus]|uniref:LanC-like protein 2 n=2 Tax=Acanthoscelides obtectus TaxID=200917 RepID=A0A9P0K991_ACAOB|nr:unnamed protein product [Acanthoscelides obtectus]CAK1648003.1 LanC-like protein 2 [Acanthoscelides obtectus]